MDAESTPEPRTLAQDLAEALDRHSAESASGTPDFVLAEYLIDCLAAFDRASASGVRWRWHRHNSFCDHGSEGGR
jgi:hypothetical protein